MVTKAGSVCPISFFCLAQLEGERGVEIECADIVILYPVGWTLCVLLENSLDNKLLIFTNSRFMSDTSHKQATTHSHSHDEGGVSEGGRNVIPPTCRRP